jgi:hypothetical protein
MTHETGFGAMLFKVGAIALLAGCASTPVGKNSLLDFLDQTTVTADQVRQHLGEPHATFERERVLAYRLSRNTSGFYRAASKSGWEGVQYDLIVLLDENGVVQKHNLVAIRPP